MSTVAASSLLSEGPFVSVAGLPMHPLVVHLVVVVLPLAALLFIFVVVVRRWRRPFDLIALAGLAIGAAGTVLAKESGEALSTYVGQPQEHADWGSYLVYLAALLFVVAALWVWFERRQGHAARSLPMTLTAIAGVLLAIAAIVLTALVGHTGAEAVWGRTLTTGAVATVPTSAASTPAGTGSMPSAPTTGTGITMADVAQHSTLDDCWSAVNGNAYDLTSWIAQHPGGEQVIVQMCGVDGTDGFDAQHGGQGKPERELASLLVGPITG